MLPETQWTLVLTGDVDEVLQPVSEMTNFIMLLGLGSLLLTLLIGTTVATRISSPIIKLTELVNRTAELDLKYDNQYEYLTKKIKTRQEPLLRPCSAPARRCVRWRAV
ncbi:hypothetical protein ACFTAO_13615 [Paenibacillus rhizoplanae]